MSESERVPRLARPFVACLVVSMLACAAFALEPWPFTSFRLFSTVRVDQQTAWSAATVDAEGNELAYALGGEDRGFRGFPFTMTEFVGADADRRRELCATWLEAAPELVGREAIEVRLYLRTWTLSDRGEGGALPGRTTLEYRCTEGGVEAVD